MLLGAHREQTIERMEAYERVLVVQDSSYLDLTHYQSMRGRGPLGTEKQNMRGLVMHSALALTELGMSLGIVHQSVWARPEPSEPLGEKERQARPIEEKERYKWLVGLAETPKLAGTEVVTICDAEADVYELLALAIELEKGLLVRASQDRALMPPEVNLIRQTVGATQLRAQLTLKLQAKESEPAREAKGSVRYKQVKLKPPHRPKGEGYESLPLKPLTLWAVQVCEVNPPPDCTPVEWLLLTTLSVQNTEDALQRIRWYCQRWQIEIWHKILKSGCRIEHRRLKDTDRLLTCLALYVIIAWRLHWLTHLARQEPNALCTTALTDPEW